MASEALTVVGPEHQAMAPQKPQRMTLEEMKGYAGIFKASGLSKENESVLVIKILAGQAHGMEIFTAVNSFEVIDGKLGMKPVAMAAQIRKSRRYDYRILYLEDDGCKIEFLDLDNQETLGIHSFLRKDAEKAGLVNKDNWKRYPRDMYYSRCMSGGTKKYCPDVLEGNIYTPEEISEFDAPPRPPAPQAPPAPAYADTAPIPEDDGEVIEEPEPRPTWYDCPRCQKRGYTLERQAHHVIEAMQADPSYVPIEGKVLNVYACGDLWHVGNTFVDPPDPQRWSKQFKQLTEALHKPWKDCSQEAKAAWLKGLLAIDEVPAIITHAQWRKMAEALNAYVLVAATSPLRLTEAYVSGLCLSLFGGKSKLAEISCETWHALAQAIIDAEANDEPLHMAPILVDGGNDDETL